MVCISGNEGVDTVKHTLLLPISLYCCSPILAVLSRPFHRQHVAVCQHSRPGSGWPGS